MTKILLVSDYLDKIGGIETYIRDLKSILENNGYKVKLYGYKDINKFKKIKLLIKSFFNFSERRKLEKTIKDFKPDIVWFHSISRALGTNVLKIKENFPEIKTIFTFHDFGYFAPLANKVYNENDIPKKLELSKFMKNFFSNKSINLSQKIFLSGYIFFKYFKLKAIQKNSLNYIDFHTGPSKIVCNYIIQQNFGTNNNSIILPNFILKSQVGKRKDILQDKINFIFFGRLTEEKGIGYLINFFSELWELKFSNKEKFEKIKSKARFFIFGDGPKKEVLLKTFIGENIFGEDISILKDISKEEINFDKIKEENKLIYFFGFRSYNEILQFLEISHFHICPSLFLETFGLSAAQAAANQVVNIGLNKENINSFILKDYLLSPICSNEEFNKKLFDLIENFDKTKWKQGSYENFLLVKDFII